ncbi:hypothetical protein ACETIH_22990 [Microvirga arabica]|uniref:Uncharacterized protein n=1 Tax=Microvirga arabica TaxID=1128671 RepID=A0ABV6YE18_9HYPH
MAIVTAYLPLDMRDLSIGLWTNLVATTETPTHYSGYYGSDPSRYVAFSGTGFKYSPSGPNPAGIANHFYEADASGRILYEVHGIAVPLQVLVSWPIPDGSIDPTAVLLQRSDTICGSPFADILGGFGGDDTLTGGGGHDILAGGDGVDTAVLPFSLESSSFSVTYPFEIPALTISQGSNSVALLEIEQIRFSDVLLDLGDGNALVDDLFYTRAYSDVFAAHVDPESHYASFGWQEGRDPNDFFSTSGYLSANPDIRLANINPLQHFNDWGWREGRDPSFRFDTGLYLQFNPDVAAAHINPLEHFIRYGQFEGRVAYSAVGRTIQNGFDAEYYLLANPDVGAAGVDAAFHFQTWGWKEGRDPNAFFDTSAYLAAYEDVRIAGVNPLEHYMELGWQQGRDPSENLSTYGYLLTYTDVLDSGINPLQHFLQFGIYEGRSSVGDFF